MAEALRTVDLPECLCEECSTAMSGSRADLGAIRGSGKDKVGISLSISLVSIAY